MRVRARTLWSPPGWRPFQVTRTPSWCGHAIPIVALPRPDGWWKDVLVLGADRRAAQPSGAMGAARLADSGTPLTQCPA